MRLGLIASLVSQFFSREFCGKWDFFLAKISVRVSRVSREEKNAIYCDVCESCNLRDTQTSKIIIHRGKLVLNPKFSQDSRVKISHDSCESCYEISICETRESHYEISLRDSRDASLTTTFISARLVRSDSRYDDISVEASLATNFDSWASVESRENFRSKKRVSLLARISKSDSCVNPRWDVLYIGHLGPKQLLSLSLESFGKDTSF